MKNIRTLLLITMILLLSGCNLKQSARQNISLPGSDSPQAWIDAPLPGAHLPLAPYEFVAHGTDQAGISQLEWILDGSSLGVMNAINPSDKLATFRNIWIPTAPGSYTLQVRAKNSINIWSDFDEAIFTVGDPVATFTPTVEITYTPTATPTFIITPTNTPTPTDSVTTTPTSVLQGGFTGVPIFSPQQLNLPNDCLPTSLTAEIKVTSTQGILVVVMFYRVADKNFTEHSEWGSISMRPMGANTYRVSLEPIKGGGLMPWLTAHWSTTWEGWLTTQFIIQDINGGYTRSEVYSQVKIGGCR